MTRRTIGSWAVMLLGALYFFVPLLATFEFSLRYRRGVYSFEAYRIVLGDPRFHATFLYSTVLALATIVVGILLVVPTAYWIQLRLPKALAAHESLAAVPDNGARMQAHAGERRHLQIFAAGAYFPDNFDFQAVLGVILQQPHGRFIADLGIVDQ